MSKTKTIILPDGSKCHTGPNCKRHGITAQTTENSTKVEQLKTKIDSLFTAKKPYTSELIKTEEETEGTLPEWWNDSRQQSFEWKKKIFQQFGLKEAKIPTFNENAMNLGYIEVITEDKDINLIVDTDGRNYQSGEKAYCRAWLYKHGKPVAMLRFGTYRKNYVPPEGSYPHAESVICDVEVHPEHTGKGHAMEIIRQVEKNILNGRLIHSGGSYTPEGAKALGGKLPYTGEAKYKYKKIFEAGEIPKSSYSSMKFVHDWDKLQKMTS